MRVENWNPNKFDEEFENICMDRLVDAAQIVADKTRKAVPHKLNLSRPVYKRGPHAGKPWTSREAGRLKKSVRVRRKKTKSGAFSRKRNVRIYAGDPWGHEVYLAYYGAIVEFKLPYLRPSFWSSMPEIKAIIGVR